MRRTAFVILIVVMGVVFTANDLLARRAARQASAQGTSAAPGDMGFYLDGRRPLYVLDDAYMRWPLPANEQAYAGIEGKHIKDYVNEITAISRQSRDDGNQYWGRIAGTKYDMEAEQWVMKKFQDAGLQDVRRQEFDLPPQWFANSWELSTKDSKGVHKIISAFPFERTPSTPPSGLDLELAYVGLGRAADFFGRDVKGKAVVIYSEPAPGVRDNSAQWYGSVERAEKEQAAAVLVILGIPGNIAAQTPVPSTVPTFMLGEDDGNYLMDLIDQAGPSSAPHIRVRLEGKTVPGLKTGTVWGTLPGMTDETIYVTAHHDAYFEGALDNASGLGTMVTLAEHYAKIPKAQRRRTMIFLGTPGHHAGDPGTQWLHDHRDTVFSKTALILNCEHTSLTQTYLHGPYLRKSDSIGARRWSVRGSPHLEAILVKAFDEFGVTTYAEPDARGGGVLVKIYKDAPSMMLIDTGPFYHTDLDRPDIVPTPGLEGAARSFAKVVDEVNKVDRGDLLAPESAP